MMLISECGNNISRSSYQFARPNIVTSELIVRLSTIPRAIGDRFRFLHSRLANAIVQHSIGIPARTIAVFCTCIRPLIAALKPHRGRNEAAPLHASLSAVCHWPLDAWKAIAATLGCNLRSHCRATPWKYWREFSTCSDCYVAMLSVVGTFTFCRWLPLSATFLLPWLCRWRIFTMKNIAISHQRTIRFPMQN